MISAVLDHLWQSTLVALAAGGLAIAFRRTRASVRYGLWFAASAKFLVPFAALAALGGLLAPALRPPVDATPDAALLEQATQPFSHAIAASAAIQAAAPAARAAAAPASAPLALHAAAPAAHAPAALDAGLLLLGLWAIGCAAVLAVWIARWAKVRAAVREASPLPLAAPMPVLASSWMREPGLVGVRRPVLLVPETLFDHLDQRQIDALVAHEACHLRRRDNLTAAVHMLAEALFWFHPLVWWIGARLIDERERACDEAVVRAGHDRAAYARSLVECCRLYLQSPLTCVAGASGSYLRRRVEAIMTAPPSSPLSRPARTFLVAAGACALATPVAAGWLASPTGHEAAAHVAAVASRAAAGVGRAAPAAPGRGGSAKAVALAQADASTPRAAAAAQPSPEVKDANPAVGPEAKVDLSLPPIATVNVSDAALPPLSARTPEAASIVPVADLAPGTSPGAVIADPVWVQLPPMSWSWPDYVYPSAAEGRDLPGLAILQCRANNRGGLDNCVVAEETPAGQGFGKSALLLAPKYRLRTTAADGTPVQGRLVDVAVEFTPRYYARIVGEASEGQTRPRVVRWVTDPFDDPYIRAAAAYYPAEALSKGVAAAVTLHCKVRPGGHLSNCEVARESPTDLGFGRLALLAKPYLLQVETRALDGSPMAGRTVEVRYVFNPPCDIAANADERRCGAVPMHPPRH